MAERWYKRFGRRNAPPTSTAPEGMTADDRIAAEMEEMGPVVDFRPATPGLTDEMVEVIRQYEAQRHTPELLTATFQAIWKEREAKVADLLTEPLAPVEPCTYTQEQIDELEKADRRIGYMPSEFAQKRNVLRVIFKGMWGPPDTTSKNSVTNDNQPAGWFDYDAQMSVPNTNMTEADLRNKFKAENREGMNLNQYIIAGQDSKLLTGKYLDQGTTWTRLLASRLDGGVTILARFNPDGKLDMRTGRTFETHPRIGGRSVKVR